MKKRILVFNKKENPQISHSDQCIRILIVLWSTRLQTEKCDTQLDLLKFQGSDVLALWYRKTVLNDHDTHHIMNYEEEEEWKFI